MTVSELARAIRKRWDTEMTPPSISGVDERQAMLAALVCREAIATAEMERDRAIAAACALEEENARMRTAAAFYRSAALSGEAISGQTDQEMQSKIHPIPT